MARDRSLRPSASGRFRPDVETLERRDCPAPVVGVVGGGEITEGQNGLEITIRLSEAPRRAVQVGYVITGDGTTGVAAPGDYRLSMGTKPLAGPSGTIEFARGQTVKTVRISAADDALREGAEALRFSLFRAKGCSIAPAFSTVDVRVNDNDDYTAALVPQGDSAVAEGGAAAFAIVLSKPATRMETFYVSTQEGSALAGDYYPLRDMPVMILPGQTRSQSFTLGTIADADATETDEYFLVNARPKAPDVPTPDPVGVTIKGTGPAAVELRVNDVSVTEGNAGVTSCTFTVRLSAPALDPITVQYRTTDDTAVEGEDYVATTGSLLFARGEISKTVTVPVVGDTVAEDVETFLFDVSTVVGGVTATNRATGTILNDDSTFQIVVTFPDTTLTPAQQQVFREAAGRWSQIITGDLPDMTYNGRVIDDLEIEATAPLIDGPSGILGQATYTDLRPAASGGLPYLGFMQFDSADVAMMMSRGTFKDVILHEMGHVLGIGSLWSDKGLVTGIGTSNPQYTGTHALDEYAVLLGGATRPTGVPVENVGGAGSVGAHWRESVFDNELMTSIAEPSTVAMPISRLTTASLEDLGYQVNYFAADPYRLPGTVTASTASARSPSLAAALAMALDRQRGRAAARNAAFGGFV